jgi:hypothetical protein
MHSQAHSLLEAIRCDHDRAHECRIACENDHDIAEHNRISAEADAAAAQTAATAAQNAASAAQSALSSIGGCWVAREVYGVDNPRWLLFRHWMLSSAPHWFFDAYARHGARFADWISDKPVFKTMLRAWMDTRVREVTLQPAAANRRRLALWS